MYNILWQDWIAVLSPESIRIPYLLYFVFLVMVFEYLNSKNCPMINFQDCDIFNNSFHLINVTYYKAKGQQVQRLLVEHQRTPLMLARPTLTFLISLMMKMMCSYKSTAIFLKKLLRNTKPQYLTR